MSKVATVWALFVLLGSAHTANSDPQPATSIPDKSPHVTQPLTQPSNEKAEPNKNAIDRTSPVVNPHASSVEKSAGNQRGWFEKWWPYGYGLITLVLLGAQILIYWRQSNLMKSQALIMEATLDSQLPKLMLLEIDFGEMGVSALPAKIQYPNIRISVKNYGQTPAFVEKLGAEIACVPMLPPEPNYDRTAHDVPPETVVVPGEEFSLPELRPAAAFSEEDVQAVMAESKSLFVYGFIQYKSFRRAPPHMLRFCKQFVVVRVQGESRYATGAYRFTEAIAPSSYTETF